MSHLNLGYQGDSPLPLPECRAAMALSTRMLKMLDELGNTRQSTRQKTSLLQHFGTQDDFPPGCSQDLGLDPLDVELDLSQN